MTKRIGSIASKTERSITLLKERRSALVTAAVTGQIDLRGEPSTPTGASA
jgi:type I restriction enzyme S subunit